MSLSINIAKADFLPALAALQNVTGKKGTMAILANVLIQTESDAITLTATDLEVGVRVTLPAEIIGSGTITLPAKKLFEIVRESGSSHLHLEVTDNLWVRITADASKYKLAGMDAEEYPAFPDYNRDALASVSCDILRDLIDKTVFSIASEGESQYNLTAALLEKETKEDHKQYLRIVTSDGHRLSLMEREVDTDIAKLAMEKTILMPRKGLQEIRKFCEGKAFVEIGFDDKQAVLFTDNAVIVIRLMHGDFPDYRNIVNFINRELYVDIDRLAFIHAMKRINLFTEDMYSSVQFSFETDMITLSSQNMDIGSAKDEIKVSYSGEPFQLGFNGKYFIEALQVLVSEKVRVYINSGKSPCLLDAADDPGFLSVIMPMKL